MGKELVDIFYCGKDIEVYGCWTNEKPPEGTYEFYDLYVNGECVSINHPWLTKPTVQEAVHFVKTNT